MSFTVVAELTFLCFVVSLVATGGVLWWLKHRQILDEPNHRSSHTNPTPRGGGLALVPILAVAWAGLAALGLAPLSTLPVIAVAVALAMLCWRDDRGGLPVLQRFGAQFVAILFGLLFVRGAGHVFQGLLPPVLDYAATALIWLWFVNLFNFMDGIDGITGGQTAAIGFGAALVAFVSSDPNSGALPLGLALGAAALGFLAWNWAPAKLFMGDVGSIPLGYLIGWLMLSMAGDGHWAPALILPLYYLVDATITLLRRAVRFERIWHAHREHFYQRAVQSGLGHGAVVLRILAADLLLVGLAVLGLDWPWIATILAIVVVGTLLWELGRRDAVTSEA
ncbi:glycosyl transferase [Aliidongia dinghuensis]|uniref:Glycosyl transferase n=1 Tax=Aliidongia dinghuensis TaxID=1867774 RepID=A0A8J3E5C1_9PROT|nr:glycosyltransferase family 4 protein [Aliidongia dinghuensis]GGF31097.1 glycosyl transferase [Aliidongia dinghuensis]